MATSSAPSGLWIELLKSVDFLGGSDGKECACSAGGIWVRSLGREDSLEREMATHSSIYVYTQLLVEADWNCDMTDSKAIQVASYKVPSIRAT